MDEKKFEEVLLQIHDNLEILKDAIENHEHNSRGDPICQRLIKCDYDRTYKEIDEKIYGIFKKKKEE